MTDDLIARDEDLNKRRPDFESQAVYAVRVAHVAITAIMVIIVVVLVMGWTTLQVSRNTDKVTANQARIEANQKVICDDRNFAVTQSNNLVDELVAMADATSAFTPAEKAERARRFNATKLPLIQCSP